MNATGRVGLLAGGGPAPGINGVIGAATVEAIRQGWTVVGLLDGFKWLARGDTGHTRVLTLADVEAVRFRGGSMLGISRENPTKDPAKMQAVLGALRALDLRALVTIGGDDTAFSAYTVSREAGGDITVAHVPKTIDNDLPLPGNMPTFGFQSACAVGAMLVRGLVEDARTTRRWYVVVAMGRTAGHLALGIGNAAGASLTLIPEEFTHSPTLESVCEIIEGAIIKSTLTGRDYGVAVVAEGIAELLKAQLQEHPLVEVTHDDHGHIRLAEVPFALILKRLLQERATARGEQRTFVDTAIGYELRSQDPNAYDLDYTQQLGWGAIRYLLDSNAGGLAKTGAMISVQSGEVVPIPFTDILDLETGRTAVRRVNVNSDYYRGARANMLRLEREDLRDPARVQALAEIAGVSAEEFCGRFDKVVGE
ncbi:MAG: 6-phosphofructokinase [Armatimonadota bacterium]